ncbi:hypothetical protein [Aquitalea sp. ASV11]|uniref:hypothetical protein n=1 Tax=Aquitalea sp. ASV11 TaxID=2795103 RepID=UPI0018EAB878|nr:hypothetical protein [Aquitalea sp. ASV11]
MKTYKQQLIDALKNNASEDEIASILCNAWLDAEDAGQNGQDAVEALCKDLGISFSNNLYNKTVDKVLAHKKKQADFGNNIKENTTTPSAKQPFKV